VPCFVQLYACEYVKKLFRNEEVSGSIPLSSTKESDGFLAGRLSVRHFCVMACVVTGGNRETHEASLPLSPTYGPIETNVCVDPSPSAE
jgi:hypothetical protein